MEILLKCLKEDANLLTHFPPRGRQDLPWPGKAEDLHFAAPQVSKVGCFLEEDLGQDNSSCRKHTDSSGTCSEVQW